jgi:superfamily II DNA or RNA helicase
MNRTERQLFGIKKWIKSGCRGSLTWTTGVGKTNAAMMAIRSFLKTNHNKNITVVVPTDNLKLQWIDRLSKEHLLDYVIVEIINSSITYKNNIDFAILDECHHYCSGSFSSIFNRCSGYILGLTATYNRLDGKEYILNKYCPECDRITTIEALKENWLAKYKEYEVLIDAPDIEEYKDACLKFYEAFNVFGMNFTAAMRCVSDTKYRSYFAKQIGYSYGAMCGASFSFARYMRKRKDFVMTHPLKIQYAQQIISKRRNCKIITFSAEISQAQEIGIGECVHSKQKKKENKALIEAFAKLDHGVINTAKSLNEGADIPGLNVAIILSNTSSRTDKTQRVGRVIRKEDDKEAEIFTLVMRDTVEEKWFENSTSGNEYIKIDVDELTEILDYNSFQKQALTANDVDAEFRT